MISECLTLITRLVVSKMGWFSNWFTAPDLESDHPKYRIVKEEWPNGKVLFWIQEWAIHYACEKPFWFPVSIRGATKNSFDTQEEASTYLTKMLIPPPKPIITVVEER